jgi:hypothetical protein
MLLNAYLARAFATRIEQDRYAYSRAFYAAAGSIPSKTLHPQSEPSAASMSPHLEEQKQDRQAPACWFLDSSSILNIPVYCKIDRYIKT